MSADINIMYAAAEKAAKSLIRDFGEVEQLQISKKGPGDFVSAADRRAERIIHKELSESRPDYGFIMEESGAHKGVDGAPIFVVDPLDGTSNFLHGLPHWCISIAIVENGQTKAGLVYAPVTDEVFYAERGEGAMVNKKRLRVSNRTQFDGAMIATGELRSTSSWHEQNIGVINKIGEEGGSVRRLGACALDLSYVAAGRLEGFWETGIKMWDVAAGMLIVEESLGKVTSLNQSDKNPLTSQSILASNGAMHEKLESLIGHVEQ